MHSGTQRAVPRTPDRKSAVWQDLSVEECRGAAETTSLLNKIISCSTPTQQLPMRSPMTGNAPGTGCSGASRVTSARGVATPLRASRRRSTAVLQDEAHALTPRALCLCECGHCSACVCSSQAGFVAHPATAAASSLTRCEATRLSDLASPAASTPGLSPAGHHSPRLFSETDVAAVMEIPLGERDHSSAQDLLKLADPRQMFLPVRVIPLRVTEAEEIPHIASDPRLRQPPTSLAFHVSDCATGSLVQSSVSRLSSSPADPRRRRRRLAKSKQNVAVPSKSAFSSMVTAPAPKRLRSPMHSASCRKRRYRRSPTPGLESIPSSKGARYRSPTPGPHGR